MIDSSVSFTLIVNSTARIPMTITMLAARTGVNTTSWLIWRRSRFAPRHQVPDLRAVVIAEVQLLEMREELRAQHVLGAVRDVERGVPAEPRATRPRR